MVFKPELLYYLIVFSEIIEKNVTVPGFCPENCPKGEALSTLMPKIGCKTIAVVTTEGRFNITSAAFGCKSCLCIFEAKAEDYIESGFWPASPDEDSFYLFCRDFLRQWFHLQHKSASISRAANIGAALEASNEHHRISVINETHFVMASAEFEYHRFWIETDIQRADYMTYKACGEIPLASHCDELMGNGMCGGSTCQAAKLDSSGNYNRLDEMGMISTVCRPGSTIKVANMYKGETNRLVAFLHKVLWSGHLMDHASATLGEEQEQTFAKMSRYCSSTKRMSKAHRIDHLSKAILYKNSRKEKKMVSTLIQRLKTADIKELSQHLAIDSSHQELSIIVKKI
ncbi:hypothetical protein OUZ56_003482 [Daphnia magna]|uniref:CxC3 like cysteine cluster domain-containing protein n=1 Tax=Daphnia magna TaxID=35525 RepID=A0ABR0A975_9CRUS|nr:hypothetical protein OUZ56_003482 [Daphnia magna]